METWQHQISPPPSFYLDLQSVLLQTWQTYSFCHICVLYTSSTHHHHHRKNTCGHSCDKAAGSTQQTGWGTGTNVCLWFFTKFLLLRTEQVQNSPKRRALHTRYHCHCLKASPHVWKAQSWVVWKTVWVLQLTASHQTAGPLWWPQITCLWRAAIIRILLWPPISWTVCLDSQAEFCSPGKWA